MPFACQCGSCDWCRRYADDWHFRDWWDRRARPGRAGPTRPVPERRARRPDPAPCPWEGPVVAHCPKGDEGLHQRQCLHDDGPDTCRRRYECAACTLDRWTRHLLYFVYPVHGNSVWQCNVDQLLERIDLFTGRRVVAVARQAGRVNPRRERRGQRPPHTVDPPELVMDRLAGHGCEVVVLDNDLRLGEVAAFVPLLERVRPFAGPGDVTFYGHAKGVTRPVNPGVSVHPWASLLYAANLDYWPVVAEQLARFPVTGAMRTAGPATGYPGTVHYSGTFFWFRNADLFARPNWRAVSAIWGGVEAWPGAVFRPEEMGCVFGEDVVRRKVTGYDFPRLRLYLDDFARWSEAHAAQRRPGAVPRPWLARHGYE